MSKKVYVLVGATESYDLGATVFSTFEEAVQSVLHMVEESVEPEEWVEFRDKYAEARSTLPKQKIPEISIETDEVFMVVNTLYEQAYGNIHGSYFYDVVTSYL